MIAGISSSAVPFLQDGNTPFHLACKGGYLEVVQKLLHDNQGTHYVNTANKVCLCMLISTYMDTVFSGGYA